MIGVSDNVITHGAPKDGAMSADVMQQFDLASLGAFGVQLTPRAGAGATLPPLSALLAIARREKLVRVRGLAAMGREAFFAFGCSADARGEAALLQWDFGPIMELAVDPAAKNYLFSREPVPYHWDGAFHRVPSWLVFACQDGGGTDESAEGGETTFCDTESVLARATAAERAQWRRVGLTYTTAKLAHYGGSFRTPLVTKHPTRRTETLRFAEPVTTALNPVTLAVDGVEPEAADALIADVTRRTYEPGHSLALGWQTGDIVIADNHALIHGRRPLTTASQRRILRLQVL